jgi:hypothetical protein
MRVRVGGIIEKTYKGGGRGNNRENIFTLIYEGGGKGNNRENII